MWGLGLSLRLIIARLIVARLVVRRRPVVGRSLLVAAVDLRTVHVGGPVVAVARVAGAVTLVAVAIVVGTRFLSTLTYVCSEIGAAMHVVVASVAYSHRCAVSAVH